MEVFLPIMNLALIFKQRFSTKNVTNIVLGNAKLFHDLARPNEQD